jgi:ATP-dependent exoDNAse (exonuclease V) beta subunit
MSKGSFQVYKSSAGSGKTYTLVKEYLKIVLPQPDKMRQILAITFTNAAAAEMKSRILEELGNLSSLANNTR